MIHNKSYMLCRHMLLTCGGDGEQVFPTMLDAAGATDTVPSGHQIDGMSLLCLLKDPSGASCSGCTSATGCAADGSGWRQWLDLEHTTCYNATNHWSALTDGKMKYIFNACPTCTFPPREQLFNLTAVRTHSPSRAHPSAPRLSATPGCGVVACALHRFHSAVVPLRVQDPGEQTGLHAMPAYAAELAKWRGRMVAQFEKEGRGPLWVNDGKLQTRQTQT